MSKDGWGALIQTDQRMYVPRASIDPHQEERHTECLWTCVFSRVCSTLEAAFSNRSGYRSAYVC